MSAFEQHTDWVNDIKLCSNISILASASSDGTVKLWDSTKDNVCLDTLRHTDYVKVLAYAKETKVLFSSGLDQKLIMTDLATGKPESSLFHTHPESVYSLDCNAAGTVVGTGSTDKCVRIWDPRTSNRSCAVLKGHTDGIKALALDADGSGCSFCASNSELGVV
jgi:WD repeat-containing protein 48